MLTLSVLLSAAVHIPAYFGLRALAETYMSAQIRKDQPVKMVRLSPSAWQASMRQAQQAAGRKLPFAKSTGAAPLPEAKKAPAPKPDEPKPPPERAKLDGQIVEVPPTADDHPNPEAKFLSKYNSHVDKQSVARIEDRDPSKKRVTNRLQERDVSPARPAPGAVPTKGMTLEGTADRGDQPGEGAGKAVQPKKKTVMEVPDMTREDSIRLKLTEAPGAGLRVNNKRGTDALKGNSERLRLELGEDLLETPGQAGGAKGSPNAQDGLPSLAALKPTVGTIARISGSPSRDHIEGLPEGDGTFLNTKEFKYATFFFRVRDSVAGYWDDLVAQEYRRRDPTGNIYGVRNRATLLTIQLSPEGRLTEVRVASSSGVEFLDAVAVQAFKMAEPFPNPPTGIADEDGRIRFNFQFTVVHSGGPFNLFR